MIEGVAEWFCLGAALGRNSSAPLILISAKLEKEWRIMSTYPQPRLQKKIILMGWRITGWQTYSYAVKERKDSEESEKTIAWGIKLLVQENCKSYFYLSVLINV